MTAPRTAGRPPLAEHVRALTLRLPLDLWRQVHRLAKREGVSIAEWIRTAIEARLG